MILDIVCYPDPFLREPSKPVEVIDDEIRQLARDMIETMYAAKGVGLAAPQVGVHKRLVIVDFDPDHRDPHVLINPMILKKGKGKSTMEEGCLSVPGINAKVTRAAEVTVRAQDLDGNVIEYEGEGLTATAFQHEIDHIDGILFIDKVSPAAKLSIRGELAALEETFAPKENA